MLTRTEGGRRGEASITLPRKTDTDTDKPNEHPETISLRVGTIGKNVLVSISKYCRWNITDGKYIIRSRYYLGGEYFFFFKEEATVYFENVSFSRVFFPGVFGFGFFSSPEVDCDLRSLSLDDSSRTRTPVQHNLPICRIRSTAISTARRCYKIYTCTRSYIFTCSVHTVIRS